MNNYPPSYQPPPQYAAPPQTHTMAIVSLVFGLLGITGVCAGIGPIVAIICGNMALGDIRAHPNQYGGEGIAKAGVIIGWVGVALAVCAICGVILYFVFVAGVVGLSFSSQ
jgi:hypothetical protein